MNIEISSAAINEYLAKAILDSAIGTSLKAAIDAETSRITGNYDNPYKRAIEAEILKLVREVFEQEFAEKVREEIRQKISEKFVSELLGTLWDKFLEKRF